MARRLNAPALGIALGIVWGACVVLMTWLNWISGGLESGWFAPWVRALDSCYPLYGPGFLGGIWGGILGFIDGLIGGVLVAVLYNRFATPIEEPPAPEPEDEPEPSE